ncbi:MAG: hypothetical protein C4318_03305 [Acidimicrobiia bacterium]
MKSRTGTEPRIAFGSVGSYLSPIIELLVRRGWDALDFQPRAATILSSDLKKAADSFGMGESSLPNAYLFTGPAGCGQEEAFLLLAASNRCIQPRLQHGVSHPCWMCSECRMVLHGSHPDVLVFEPEGNTYLVEFVRDRVVAEAKFSALRGGHRFVLLREAERLSRAASNALLRTVEEPNARLTFVFGAAPDRQAVLDTLASRCREVAFYPIPAARIEKLLVDAGVDQQTAMAAAGASEGSLQWAAQAVQTGSYGEFTAYVASLLLPLFYDLSTNPLEVSGMLRERIEALRGEVGSAIDDEMAAEMKLETELGLASPASSHGTARASKHRRLRRIEQTLCLQIVTVLEYVTLVCALLKAGLEDQARFRLETLGQDATRQLERLKSAPLAASAGSNSTDCLVKIARLARVSLASNPRLEVWLDRLVTEVWATISPV